MHARINSSRIDALFVCLMVGALLRAQQPAAIQNEGGVYTLHADTHMVLLDVTVADKQGHPVTGLTKDDFKLTEDGQPQTIKFFEEHAPVDPAEIAKEKAAALAAQIKLLDEQIAPVEPAEIERQKAAALAGQPLNTFTNYEPFTGRPVTVLLLNELFPRGMMMSAGAVNQRGAFKRPGPFQDPEQKKMLDLVRSAPPDTQFAVYRLDSQLHLVQPITTDRALLLGRIDLIWKSPTPQFGSEQLINPTGLPPDAEIPVRRRIFTDAMQQLASSLEGVQGRKNLYVFTGPFQCSVVQRGGGCAVGPFPDDNYYTCKWMDALEQGRMSIYRYYGQGDDFAHGFGCSRSVDLGTSANYYTLYYTPTNGNWDGKYRATKIEVTEKDLHLAYRQGYYGTPENVEAHYYKRRDAAPIAPSSSRAGSGQTIAASTVAAGTAAPEITGTSATLAPPNPVSSVFTVQVVPASATNATDKDKEECRQLTLRLSMPANEFKVVQSDSGQYVARLLISAVGYSDGKVAASDGSQAVQMAVNFDGAADPRISTSTITAEMTLNELERGKDRWLLLTVRDQATGQFGSLVIPMEQIKMPMPQ